MVSLSERIGWGPVDGLSSLLGFCDGDEAIEVDVTVGAVLRKGTP